MTYPISLAFAEFAAGTLLLLSHLPALFAPQKISALLSAFPRSLWTGRLLLVAATVWAAFLVATIDLGEFATMRNSLVFGVAVSGVLTWIFVGDFLAVRALSILLLLAADVLLSAAFLQPETSRLWLVFLAYGWIFAGMFLVGLPWLARDTIAWITKKRARLLAFSCAGALYGIALLVSSFLAS